MAPLPGPYSGKSTLALVISDSFFDLSLNSRHTCINCSVCIYWEFIWIRTVQVARVSAFSVGLVYGSIKLKVLQVLCLFPLILVLAIILFAVMRGKSGFYFQSSNIWLDEFRGDLWFLVCYDLLDVRVGVDSVRIWNFGFSLFRLIRAQTIH